MMIRNYCPFTVDANAGWDHKLREYYVVIVAAAFEAKPGCVLRPAEDPAILRQEDEYFGEPFTSSVCFEADFAPEKPKVDILINGQAYAPRGKKIKRINVSMRVGSLYKELMVTGDRTRKMFGDRAKPFDVLPIVYECSYGGSPSEKHTETQNPVGVGYRGAYSTDPAVETRQPNIEYPDGRRAPAGFGVVARHWQPRLKLAGTYNDAWLASRWPLLPADFHPAHHQATPLDQQISVIRGGELVELVNMTPDGLWRFQLPSLDLPVHLWYADRGETADLRIDTVFLEPTYYRVTLTARVKILVARNRAPLREVIVGHITQDWWRSRLAKEPHYDPQGLEGRCPEKIGYLL